MWSLQGHRQEKMKRRRNSAMKMKLTKHQADILKRIEIGTQRLRRDRNFAAQSRGLAPFSVRELVLLAYYAGTH
jgi:hypothetical protein